MIVYPLLCSLHAACIPIGILFIVLSRRRETSNLCANCAYDLRGAASLQCPECGHQSLPGAPRPLRGARWMLMMGIASMLVPILADLLVLGTLIYFATRR